MNKERSVINKGIPNKENPNLESKEIGLLLSVCEADTPCGTKVRRMTNCVTWSFMLMRFLWLLLCTTRFNIQKFCVLSTHWIYVFCVDQRTNSDYFTIQH